MRAPAPVLELHLNGAQPCHHPKLALVGQILPATRNLPVVLEVGAIPQLEVKVATCRKVVRLGVQRRSLLHGKTVTLKSNHRAGLRVPKLLTDGAMDLVEKAEENGVNLEMERKMVPPALPGRERVPAGTRAPEDGESLLQE